MRVPDRNLAEVWDQGFTIVENFLDADTLAAAREAMWEIYPKPDDYFRAPEEHSKLVSSQFGGLRVFPYKSWALNRLPSYPDLVDGAERLLGTEDLEIYKIELWAKYSGAVNYDELADRVIVRLVRRLAELSPSELAVLERLLVPEDKGSLKIV